MCKVNLDYMDTQDYGPQPYVVNIEDLTLVNQDFRVTKWTGKHLQMTVMTIPVEGEVGLEKHGHIDQFIRIEQGSARVLMGDKQDALDFDRIVEDDWAIFIPAGTWHNVLNNGDEPLKLYSIYSPAEHPQGTIHKTFEESEAAEAAEEGGGDEG